MIYSKDIMDAHLACAKTSADFLIYATDNPACLQRATFRQLLALNDDVISLQPWPTFINQELKERMALAAQSIFNLLKQIPRKIFQGDTREMSEYYCVSEDIIKLQLEGVTPQSLDSLLARGDFILSPSGLKCLEFNVSVDVGGWQVAFWENVSRQIPLIDQFFRLHNIQSFNSNLLAVFFNHLIHSTLATFPAIGSSTPLNLAVVFPGYQELASGNSRLDFFNQLYQECLQQEGLHPRGQVFFCDYPQLNVTRQQITFKNYPVHCLIELYNGIVPPEIMDVFKCGQVTLLNGPITKLMSNKLNLALLWENLDKGIFSPRERQIIKEYIPWTHRVADIPVIPPGENSEINLLDALSQHKERWVLKSPMESGGYGVYVGRFTNEEKWRQTIALATQQGNWSIQEYIESYHFMYQHGQEGCISHRAVWGIFVFGIYAGAWVRVQPDFKYSGLINSLQGAEQGVVFTVSD